MTTAQALLSKWFKFQDAGTTLRTEMLAGLTTFLTMFYVVLVNPEILSQTGMNLSAVFMATCLTGFLGSFLVGVLANYPIAIAPSMGLNAYFTYVVVQSLGYSWERALAAVFISGIIFFFLTITKIRRWIIEAIPASLCIAISVGIGLFIALIALKTAHLIEPNAGSLLRLHNLNTMGGLLFGVGFFTIIALEHARIPGSILIGILVTTVLSLLFKVTAFHGVFSMPPSMSATWLHLDLTPKVSLQDIIVIFSFFLVALFDGAGTLIGVIEQTKLKDDPSKLSRISNALLAESITTTAGSLLGTSTTTPYIESAAGVRAGGRTGMTAIVVSVLFLGALFLSPLAHTVPDFASAPALLYVACLMIRHIGDLDWSDLSEGIPCVITILMIPFSFSIADGIGLGFISYTALKLMCGKYKDLNTMLVLVSALFIVYFLYTPK